MKNRAGKLLIFVAALGGWILGEALAQPGAIPPPPRVRVKSQELYRQHEAFMKVQVDALDTNNPVRYAFLDATYTRTEEALLIGEAWRKWGHWIRGSVLDVAKPMGADEEWRLVLPAYTVYRGPDRRPARIRQNVKAGRDFHLALKWNTNGYWIVEKALNRHDFAELKMIGERVALTGKDDTIGVRKSCFQLHMNPLQTAYYAARKKVTAGQMTEQELRQQFTEEMIEAVYHPNNADLVLGKE
jgi:hypothetical protein